MRREGFVQEEEGGNVPRLARAHSRLYVVEEGSRGGDVLGEEKWLKMKRMQI
jgi:hypothetical protein